MSVSPIVIKVGGALLDDTAAMTRLFLSVKDVQATRPVVVVHGGGPLGRRLWRVLVFKAQKLMAFGLRPMNICLISRPSQALPTSNYAQRLWLQA